MTSNPWKMLLVCASNRHPSLKVHLGEVDFQRQVLCFRVLEVGSIGLSRVCRCGLWLFQHFRDGPLLGAQQDVLHCISQLMGFDHLLLRPYSVELCNLLTHVHTKCQQSCSRRGIFSGTSCVC